jgi:hypothetical protein
MQHTGNHRDGKTAFSSAAVIGAGPLAEAEAARTKLTLSGTGNFIFETNIKRLITRAQPLYS